jgi:hypothetical protein
MHSGGRWPSDSEVSEGPSCIAACASASRRISREIGGEFAKGHGARVRVGDVCPLVVEAKVSVATVAQVALPADDTDRKPHDSEHKVHQNQQSKEQAKLLDLQQGQTDSVVACSDGGAKSADA